MTCIIHSIGFVAFANKVASFYFGKCMFLLVVGLLLAIVLFHELYWKRRKYPPGPIPLPIIGNLLDIYRHEPGYDAYIKWRKQYGPVYTYWLGIFPIVTFTDYETIKETVIMEGDKYANRFHMAEITEYYRGGSFGVIETDGDRWKDQRRFTLHTLRDFGMGRNIMEQRVLEEVDPFLERLAKSSGGIYMQREFDIGVGSIINNILFGYRFDDDKLEEFYYVKSAISRQMKEFAHPLMFLMLMWPWLRYFPYFSASWKRLFEYRDALFGFFRQQIRKRETTINIEDETNRDFVECFLKERNRKKDTLAGQYYCDLQLQNLVFDLWIAGMETTSNTLTWGIVYILNYPSVQTKIHEELDRVVKSDRKVTLADKNDLPFLNATIYEIQRLANLLPQNLFRRTTDDVSVKGFKIAKNTTVIPQISCVMYDEKVFPQPYKFDPDRFLNEEGGLRKVEELIPFSVGKRQCIGEGLARMELFLFLANIFQRFKVRCEERPSMKKSFGTTAKPPDFSCFMNERHT